MAALTDKDALIARFGDKILIELTDRTEPRSGQINTAVLDGAITSASDFVLSFLRERYDITSLESEVPAPVDSYVEDLVLWFLSNKPTAWIEAKYQAALVWLNLARKGSVTLGLSPAGVAPSSSYGALYSAPGKDMTNARLEPSFFRVPVADDGS